jgi:hypothetical protein
LAWWYYNSLASLNAFISLRMLAKISATELMITDTLDSAQLTAAIDQATAQLLQLLSSFSEVDFYTIPLDDSWTAAQVYEHIIKSNESIAQALGAPGPLTQRQPDERVLEVKELFLSTTNRFQSPESVLPTSPHYEREVIIHALEKLREDIKHLSTTIDKQETVNVPGFGELTKLELLHFIIYHTQRHLRQLKNILKTITQAVA